MVINLCNFMQANKLIAGFRKGPLDNLELMDAMFEDAHVDGSSAVMPGVPKEVPADLVDLVDEKGSAPTPPSVNKKRGAARIACSPGKKKKSPMQQDLLACYVNYLMQQGFHGLTIALMKIVQYHLQPKWFKTLKLVM